MDTINHFKFIQANLHHAKGASDVIMKTFNNENLDIALIQEPYLVNERIKLLDEKNLLYESCSSGRPRACILFSKNTKYFPMTEFVGKDLVAAKIDLEISGYKQKIVVCSAYLPGDTKEMPNQLTALINYCRTKNKHLIIGCDANAHHIIWGSTNINERGNILMELISESKLDILNKGSTPTFVTSNRAEVLDLTLSSSFIAERIHNWRVTNEVSLSDHKHIQFELQINNIFDESFRNPQKTDWVKFENQLSTKMKDFDNKINNIQDLNNLALKLQMTLIESYKTSCLESIRKTNRNVPWWNANLESLRKKSRKLFNKAKTTGDWESYKSATRLYNKEIKKAKLKSWDKFCENMNDIPSASRLHKILAKNHANKIGSLIKPDHTYTSNEEETLELLANEHFPEHSYTITAENEISDNTEIKVTKESLNIFSINKIRWAIMKFSEFKSPGDDEIFPALLQKGFEHIKYTLKSIFTASYCSGYIPKVWRKVLVTYIPKAGKRSSNQPRSFRPISLSSFLQKTMERILENYIKENIISRYPLHENQFAYQQGKSTTSAIQCLTNKIKKTMENSEIALVASVDIEGAFDNVSYEAMQTALEKRRCPTKIINWIKSMLKSREMVTKMGKTSKEFKATKGCPQGGVLSPLLWTLVADEILNILQNQRCFVIAYADDIIIVIIGKFGETVSNIMKHTLKFLINFTENMGLSINSTKTIVVPFTRLRKERARLIDLKISETTTIPYSEEL